MWSQSTSCRGMDMFSESLVCIELHLKLSMCCVVQVCSTCDHLLKGLHTTELRFCFLLYILIPAKFLPQGLDHWFPVHCEYSEQLYPKRSMVYKLNTTGNTSKLSGLVEHDCGSRLERQRQGITTSSWPARTA